MLSTEDKKVVKIIVCGSLLIFIALTILVVSGAGIG